MIRILPVALLGALLAACNVDPYDLVHYRDAGHADAPGELPDASIDAMADADPPDAACLPTTEICDELDNDCDTEVDEDFDTQSDPFNCGTCDHECAYVHAEALCVAGACQRGECEHNYHDNDANPDDCEYFCVITNGGVEACDTADNDCDGAVDEDFVFDTDPLHCGGCTPCTLAHVTEEGCVGGLCTVVTCAPGYVDDDGLATTGCEYYCTPTGAEACNGLDDDCDGEFDEGNPGGGVACGTDEGACTAGMTTCSAGNLVCIGSIGGSAEICNEVDDDCDGLVDDGLGIDKLTDPVNCGGCGNTCTYTNAVGVCTDGACGMGACTTGFYDIDGLDTTGCEYSCNFTADTESCDGADNDCDGGIDEGFDLLTDEANCGTCGNDCTFAHATGVCNTGTCALAGCLPGYHDIDGSVATGCEYACTVAGVETCNNIDDDCDGAIDDSPSDAGGVCGTDEGECTAGVLQCVSGHLSCAGSIGPRPETCNDLDDDCDGAVDETFDKLTDPQHCGSCAPCSVPNAMPSCVAGVCEIAACNYGFVDLNETALPDGCEYTCTVTSLSELCDGLDNDCNGVIDNGFDLTSDPLHCGSCNHVCSFANATAVCAASACALGTCQASFYDINGLADDGCEYYCTYTGPETCNGIDDDCDGAVDDSPSGVGAACGDADPPCVQGTIQCVTGSLQCVGATGGSPEICNDLDDDCDALVDEDFDKLTDAQHCGSCSPCSIPNAIPTCSGGTCQILACVYGFVDLNGSALPDGCEYTCTQTYPTELCDSIDNDCDGSIDEGIDRTSDPMNCGTCGTTCVYPNAAGLCVASTCTIGPCDTGYYDIDGLAANGCEYACTPTAAAETACDGADEDCDGLIDDDPPGSGGPCGSNDGECVAGTQTCVTGVWVCSGEVLPSPEVCDDLDNDCDLQTDEIFDKLSDPRYCGGCTPCNLAHAIEGCSGGACTIIACDPGWANADGLVSTGCEYSCTPSGPEACDGVDNDCDMLVDEDLTTPPNFCRTAGACAGTVPTCTAAACDTDVRWRCVYPAGAEVDACGNLLPNETLCDNLDGDCDGPADTDVDAYALKNTPCSDGGLGVCEGTGTYVCNLTTMTSLMCNVTDPGDPAGTESCNGLDDDCDGVPDNGAPDLVTHVMYGTWNFYMYTYEAARPDADTATSGIMEHRSCSKANALPWTNVTYTEALAACAAAGRTLCTEAQWQAACEGELTNVYPYGDDYEPDSCNGNDHDPDGVSPDDDYAVPGGSLALCISDTSVYDMSGNVKEWTSTQASASPLSYRIRGGAYDNVKHGLTCQFDFNSAEPTYYFNNLGFRCCSTTP